VYVLAERLFHAGDWASIPQFLGISLDQHPPLLADAYISSNSRVELKKIALDTIAEDHPVVGHRRGQSQRRSFLDLTEYKLRLGASARKRLSNGEVEVV
jgi:hypothetical protein